MTYDFEKQRPRELFNQQRVEGVQDDSVTMEPAFEQLPILEEDIVIDQAGHLRCLVIRDGDSTLGPHEHISYAGQSMDREHMTQFQGPNMPFDLSGNDGRIAEDHTILRAHTRQAAMFGDYFIGTNTLTRGSIGAAQQTANCFRTQADGTFGNQEGPLMFFPHTSTNSVGAMNLGSVAVGYGTINQLGRNELAFAWLRGYRANGAVNFGADYPMLTLSFNQHRHSVAGVDVGGTGIPNGTGDDYMWSSAAMTVEQNREAIARNFDFHALRMVHSTATDFFLQWRTELLSLRTFLQHFSQNESLGFYERSGRGTLWNAIDYADIPVAMWLTHLGYLQRVGVLPDNLVNNPAQPNMFAGFYSPFFLRIRNWDNAGGVREWMPDWVARLADNANFEYHADKPEYGISLEDLFMGYSALIKAVAHENGMANRSWWTPHMEFFETTAEGKLHNYQKEEAKTSVQMLRSLNMIGLENRNEFLSPGLVPDLDARQQYAYFNDFFDAGQINNVAKMDHANNMASLEEIQGLMTLPEEFKAGMQSLGLSTTTRYVETLRDGAVVNVKTNLSLVAHWRVGTAGMFWSSGTTNDLISGPIRRSHRFALAYDSDRSRVTALGLHDDNAVTMGIPSVFSDNWGNWASVCYDVPSACAGHGQYDERAQHARTQTLVTTELGNADRNWLLGAIGNLGYGALTTPNGVYLSGGMDVGTYSEEYWAPSKSNMFVHLFTATSEMLKYWQTSHTALPRKSNLDIPSASALNLVREMTMMQGESLIQKNMSEILHFIHCGMNPDYFSLQDRVNIDRQLDNPDVHVRPGRFADAPGADYLTFLLPETLVPEDILEVVTLGDMLLYRCGLKRHTPAIFGLDALADHGAVGDVPTDGTSNRIAHTLQLVSPSTRHYMLYSRASTSAGNAARGTATVGRAAADGGEVTLAMNAKRDYVVVNRFRDGEVELVQSYVNTFEAPIAGVAPLFSTATALCFLQNTPMYDYVTTQRANGYIVNFGSTRFVPGLVEYFQSWPLSLDAAAASGMGNSLCGLGGVLNVPVAAGSTVPDLIGYAAASPALVDFLTEPGLPAHLQMAAGDALIANNLGFDPELWRRVCDARGNIDDWAWLRHNWHVLAIDQDILDFDRGFFRALCAGNRITVYGPSLRMVLVNKDAEIVREQDAFYTSGSLGGVAVGKGQYSGDDSEVDLDGDVRTENGYEG